MGELVYLVYGLIGCGAGLLAGLLGVGGGVIAVPALLGVFSLIDMPQAYRMHMAVATSLAAMIFNTLSSTLAHHKRQGVVWSLVKKTVLSLSAGGLLGALLVDESSGVILEVLFGVFLCGIGLLFFRRLQPSLESHALPKNPWLSLLFFGVGTLSILLGLSGGVFSVPLLTAFKVPPKKAIGTSAAMACSMTIVGTCAFFVLGMDNLVVPYAGGYVYLPAFVIIGVTSALTAPLGAKLAHQLPDHLLRKVFGLALMGVGITMLW